MATKSTEKPVPPHVPIPGPDLFDLPPTNFELIMGERVDDLTRIRGWDEDRFERYIHEWAFTLQKAGKYGKVVWAPGAGDKGRDIRAYVTDESGEWDNFQCKFYKDMLTPGNAWLELAKLCFYVHRGDFSRPRKYYFVAPRDLGPELSTLIGQGEKIRTLLLAEWEKQGPGTISAKLAPLDGALRVFVEAFDFNIVSFKPQLEIIEELKHTEYYKRIFGCGALVRPKPEPVPADPTAEETVYVGALFAAFAESLDTEPATVIREIVNHPALVAYLKTSRECFYRAEQLHRFGRDTFPTSHCFEDLQKQVYVGILGIAAAKHDDGFAKVRAVTTAAGQLQLGNHFLVGLNLVEVQDCHGICHQIVNTGDGRLVWVVGKKGNANA